MVDHVENAYHRCCDILGQWFIADDSNIKYPIYVRVVGWTKNAAKDGFVVQRKVYYNTFFMTQLEELDEKLLVSKTTRFKLWVHFLPNGECKLSTFKNKDFYVKCDKEEAKAAWQRYNK